MRKEFGNSDSSKMSNRKAILKLLSDRGAMSRKDIAESLKITPAAVTIICNELMDAGMLLEKGVLEEEEKRVGRRKVLVDIDYDCKYVLSIAIESNKTFITVTDLKGQIALTSKIPTEKDKKPEAFLKNVAEEAKKMLKQTKANKDKLLGIGVSVTGEVDRANGISIKADGIWTKPVNVVEILKGYFEYPIILENNVKAFSEGELFFGSGKKYSDLLIIKWGPGIGAAFSSRGSLLDRRYTRNIEIGHCVVQKNGLQCSCGKKGCLETVVSTNAIDEVLRSYIHIDSLEYQEMIDKVKDGDEEMWKILEDKIEILAIQVTNMITMLKPEKTIIYGMVFDMPGFYDRFIEACKKIDKKLDDVIMYTEIAEKMDYIGPLAVVINEFL